MGRLQHGEGLADASRHPKEDLQAASPLSRLFLLHGSKQGIRIGAMLHGQDSLGRYSDGQPTPRLAQRVQRQIELEHVDSRLTEQPELRQSDHALH